jgi:hypothetical protein
VRISGKQPKRRENRRFCQKKEPVEFLSQATGQNEALYHLKINSLIITTNNMATEVINLNIVTPFSLCIIITANKSVYSLLIDPFKSA